MNQFRVYPPLVDDLDTTIVRIEHSQMQRLGIKEGDTVRVTGTANTGAICSSIENDFRISNDSDIFYLSENAQVLPQLRPSNFVAENMADHSGAGLIPAKIEKIFDGTMPARKVTLMSLGSNSDISQFDKSKLNKAIVCKNNRFHFRDAEPRSNFAFQVTDVEPEDYTQINSETIIEFTKTKIDRLHSILNDNNFENLTKVIPITYQEKKHNVDVTIPSIEVFNGGFRFYVYVRGKFEIENQIPNGHTSIIVSMQDNIGTFYLLQSKGGGGSHSPMGFDLKYEYRGKTFNPESSKFTITVEEIIIQEQFPRPDMTVRQKRNNMMRGTKEEYQNIEKFPSFYIISGPWKAEFTISI